MNKKLVALACVVFGAVSAVAVPAAASIVPADADFNGDGWVNAVDIDMLADAAHAGSTAALFDLNEDGLAATFAMGLPGGPNPSDSDVLIYSILQTRYGDADLDGDVNFSDLVALATNFREIGEFGWDGGNFDGSHEAGTLADPQVFFSDLVALAVNWRFDGDGGAIQLPPGAPPGGHNPEPVSGLVWLIGACLSYSFANRRGKRIA